MEVFICCARRDAEVVDLLRRDVERAKCKVWVDRELTGGQEWWDTILSQIRSCSLFVFVVSPESLRSKACMVELRYALALGRPLLPVMVRDTSLQLVPREIGNSQIVDYRQRDADSAFALVNALVEASPAPALPAVLPPPPLLPMSYMNIRREEVDAEVLSYHDQTSLYVELRGRLQDEDGRAAALGLLRRLRQRRDIVESQRLLRRQITHEHRRRTSHDHLANWREPTHPDQRTHQSGGRASRRLLQRRPTSDAR
jgi:hypothetical protein